MITRTRARPVAGIGAAAAIAVLGFVAAVAASTAAAAAGFVGVSVGVPFGFPFYYPPYPPPYYPPPLPPAAYYPPAPAYPPPSLQQPSGHNPGGGGAGPLDHLYAAARLDRRCWPAVPRRQDHP